MGCCLVALIGLGAPRLALFFVWVFTDRLKIAFTSGLVAFLGFLLLPFTTLFWALAYAPVKGVSGFGLILVALGVMLDLGSYGAGSTGQRRRARA